MFVSRARYDEMQAWLRELVAAQQRFNRELTEERNSLLEKYHALKLAGAGEPAPAPAPLARTKVSAVDEVIGTVAGSNSRLRKQLKDYATRERFAGSDEQEIAHALLNWREDTDGVPE